MFVLLKKSGIRISSYYPKHGLEKDQKVRDMSIAIVLKLVFSEGCHNLNWPSNVPKDCPKRLPCSAPAHSFVFQQAMCDLVREVLHGIF